MSRTATGVLSLRVALMLAAELEGIDSVLGEALEAQFGILGQDDAA